LAAVHLSLLREAKNPAPVVSTFMLTACGDGSDDPAAVAHPTLSGTAAVGTPIVGGTVKVSCAGGSPLTDTTTSNTGAWQITTSGQTLPCAVQVSGGTIGGSTNTRPYHSIALSLSTVNITPLTDLVVANLSGQNPSTWFNGLNAAQLQGIKTVDVNTALDKIRSTFGLTSTLAGANPLTTPFQAVNGNLLDDVLEAFKAALATAGTDYNALLALAQQSTFNPPNGFDFATAYQTVSSNGGGGGGGSTSCATGDTALVFSANASVSSPYTNSQQLCFTASSTTLKFSGKTLSNPTQNTQVTLPFAAYIFTDGITSYEVVLNNGALFEINVSSSGNYAGLFAPVSPAGGGSTQPGLTLSKALGNVSTLVDATSNIIATANIAVTAYKAEWGDILNTITVITQHTIVPDYAGASYEGLTVNIAKASPMLSAQLDNGAAGVCILSWTGGTMPSTFKLCSAAGISYDRTTGVVTFNHTPMIDLVGGNGSFTISGGLSFKSY
jgi:hypothetical protein